MPLDAELTRITPAATDAYVGIPAGDRPRIDRSLGWIEQWVETSDYTVAGAYKRASEARDRGRWRDMNDTTLVQYMAPRFDLRPPPATPSEGDLRTIAAVNDRISLIRRAFSSTITLRADPTGQTTWERGPGQQVTLSASFLSADDNLRTSILMAELVAATPGVSARWQAGYADLIQMIRQGRERLGPESSPP